VIEKQSRLLRVGILGCGPIAQIAHLDACRKARNIELHAICDVAEDLAGRMAAIHSPRRTYTDYADMLADEQVEAVLIGVADQFHVPLAERALAAGKHVLVEKPLGVTVEECERLRQAVQRTGLVLQVGNNRRFDPGVEFAAAFVRERLGRMLALKAWYCDSTYRYTMTDNLQPIPVASAQARRPEGNPKAERARYFLLTHGSHLMDTARYLGGPLVALTARLRVADEAHCWFIEVEFASGALGHLDLTVPIRGDFEEGFQIYGAAGSVKGQVFLPWYHKASVVECFSTADRQFHRPLGEDAHSYKRQLEAFAATILDGQPQQGATVEDGLAALHALVAVARSVELGRRVRLDEASGGV
jgi:predicted dehydrogenase